MGKFKFIFSYTFTWKNKLLINSSGLFLNYYTIDSIYIVDLNDWIYFDWKQKVKLVNK